MSVSVYMYDDGGGEGSVRIPRGPRARPTRPDAGSVLTHSELSTHPYTPKTNNKQQTNNIKRHDRAGAGGAGVPARAAHPPYRLHPRRGLYFCVLFLWMLLFCVCVCVYGVCICHTHYNIHTPYPLSTTNQTKKQIATWGAVFARQEELLQKYACKEYLEILPLMKRHCGYARDNIPQQEDISAFLQVCAMWGVEGVGGEGGYI